MTRLSSIFIFYVSLTSSAAFGQWYDRIQTESDWESYFREGYYDYNTYQIYREIIESDNIADTAEYIVSSMGSSPVEIARSGSNPGTARPLAPQPGRTLPLPDYLRIGRKVHSGDNRGYVTIGRNSDGFSTRLKFDDENGEWKTAYRHLDLKKGRLQVILGNYTVNAGSGAGIGRFDYRPVSFEPEFARGENLLFPDNSYYNGIKLAYGSLTALFSSKKYNDVRKNVGGGFWSGKFGAHVLGLSAAATFLNSDSESRKLGSASVFAELYEGRLAAEIAYGESGFGYCLRTNENNFLVKVWHYDNKYINLQSSGFAHPDYESFSDDRFEISFRQPQKGETGFYTGYGLIFRRLRISASTEIWKKSPASRTAMFNSLYGRFELNRNFSLNAGLSRRDSYFAERSTVDIGADYSHGIRVEARTYLRIASGKIDHDDSKYHLFVSIPAAERIVLRGRIRWNYSGDFDFFMEQKTEIAGGLWLSATYRWNNDYDADLGPFFLILDKRW